MGAKVKVTGAPTKARADRIVETEYPANGKMIAKGDEVRLDGEVDGARYIFYAVVATPKGVHADLYGGVGQRRQWRSVDPERMILTTRAEKVRP